MEKKKRGSKARWIVLAVIAFLLLVFALVGFITDFLWFKELGYVSVFFTKLLTQIKIGVPVFTQLLFTFGVKYASASQAGVIFPLESVSATVFGCIFLHEIMQGVQIAGSILILLSIIISSVEFKKND